MSDQNNIEEETLQPIPPTLPVQITITELSEMIQMVHKAIDQTMFGPVIAYGEEIGKPKKILSQYAYTMLMDIVRGLVANADKVRLIPDEPPSELLQSQDDY